MADRRPALADEEYFQAIESRFAQLRGTPLLLSPKDVALVDAFWRRGIPLRIVLGAIESVFHKREPVDPVRSLSYCRPAVEAAFSEWRESRLGEQPGEEPDPAPPSAAIPYLEERAEELARRAGEEPSFAAAAAAVRAQLLRLQSAEPPALSQVEEALNAAEDALVASLLQALPGAEREALESRAAAKLEPLRARLTARAWRASLEAAVRAELRAARDVPRLTLYLL